jgi:hypothetical protein
MAAQRRACLETQVHIFVAIVVATCREKIDKVFDKGRDKDPKRNC